MHRKKEIIKNGFGVTCIPRRGNNHVILALKLWFIGGVLLTKV